MGNLLQEAIADANRVKELAYQNAKAAIEEAFQPRIQRMISSRLAEEEFEDEPEADMALDLPVDDGMPMGDEMPPEEEEFNEGKYIDDGDDGTPVEDPGASVNEGDLDEEALDEDFEKLIKELESDMDADGDNVEVVDTMAENDDVTIESIAKGLEEAEKCKQEPQPPEPKADGSVKTIKELRNKLANLQKEHRDALRALSIMKTSMNEVNLLNAKLMYSSRVMQKFELSESQQVKILETFDRAKSVREVQLIYSAINENYQGRARTSGKRIRPVNESASRSIKSPKRSTSNELEFAPRWKVLAGLRGIND